MRSDGGRTVDLWPTVRLSLGALLIVGAACARARTEAPIVPVHPEPGQVGVAVSRAVGEQVRREHGAFVVFPVFLDRDFDPASAAATELATRARLLEAFRQGGNAQYADTLAYMDDARRRLLADSALRFYTFEAEPSVRGDTAIVNVMDVRVLRTPGPVVREIVRYQFVLRAGRWQFIRRDVLYTT